MTDKTDSTQFTAFMKEGFQSFGKNGAYASSIMSPITKRYASLKQRVGSGVSKGKNSAYSRFISAVNPVKNPISKIVKDRSSNTN